MTDAQLTPLQVVSQLAELGRELDATIRLLKDAEMEAVQKRHEADMAESRAFVNSEGSMELRKHQARLAADKIEGEALVAEAVIRYLRARLRAIDTRIEIGRSMGATLRAEIQLQGAAGEA